MLFREKAETACIRVTLWYPTPMECPRAVLFDLDDTLAESFKSPAKEMIEALHKLLEKMPVAIITGAGLQRMNNQFLPAFANSPYIDRLFVFPSSSAQLFLNINKEWNEVYNLFLTDEERTKIKAAIAEVINENTDLQNVPHYGQQLFDREAQVAYTLVGVEASSDFKKNWDKDNSLRQRMIDELKKKIPEFEILMGGSTTVDVTRKGINKSYGVKWLSERLKIDPKEMLYIGDALFEGGNDYVVIPTGVRTMQTSGPDETFRLIGSILASCTA